MFNLFHIEIQNPGIPRVDDDLQLYKIFIPSPKHYLREDSFAWHITTRNFFAFLSDKPLVGSHLGQALVDLQDRLQLFRAADADNIEDLTTYMDKTGYLRFNDCPDNALAVLYYAEHFELHDMWVHAFCHCTRMNDVLGTSLEFEASNPLI
jgi:hypothetical protein